VTTSKKKAGDAGELPAADDLAGVEDLDGLAGHLVAGARATGIALTGEGGLLPALVGRVLETGLQAELTDHPQRGWSHSRIPPPQSQCRRRKQKPPLS
jgi:hypothetical protein